MNHCLKKKEGSRLTAFFLLLFPRIVLLLQEKGRARSATA